MIAALERAGAIFAEQMRPDAVALRGGSFPCRASTMRSNDVATLGGLRKETEVTIFVRQELFGPELCAVLPGRIQPLLPCTYYDNFPPRSGEVCELRLKKYQIREVTELGAAWRLSLRDIVSSR